VKVVDLPTFARAWAVKPAGFGWLLGAGASASAGVPTADQLCDDLLLRLYASENGLDREALPATDLDLRQRIREQYSAKGDLPAFDSPAFYGQIFQRVMPSPESRRKYLQSQSEGKTPCFGQRVFGALIEAGHVDFAATTNFEDLIERAAAAAHLLDSESARRLTVASLGSADRATIAVAEGAWALLIKLHGDFAESSLKNLEDEVRTQDEALRRAVVGVSAHFALAVAGYSGRDRSVMDMLAAARDVHSRPWPNGIWWIVRPGEGLSPSLSSRLAEIETGGVEVFVVEAENFDETMAALAAQVELAPAFRTYVRGLRAPMRVHPVKVPEPLSVTSLFPVLRFNALPVVGQPTTALRAQLAPDVDRPTFDAAMRAAAWRGCAALAGDHVLAFGRPDDLLRVECVQGPVEQVSYDLLSEDVTGTVISLASEAMARAIARRVHGRAQVGRSPHRVILLPTAKGVSESEVRQALLGAYKEPLTGVLPIGKFGATLDGAARSYSEGIKLHLQRALGQTWLIFEPFTWTERSAEMARAPAGTRVLNSAGPWINQRWAGRKQNETWAAIIAAWAAAIATQEPVTELFALSPKGVEDSAAVGGAFLIGHATAYSRKAT
jgi:hypothetical protein